MNYRLRRKTEGRNNKRQKQPPFKKKARRPNQESKNAKVID
jgi:hypothetical protein